MNISLTQHQEELVKQKVASGMYHSSSEVIREGLRLLEDRDLLKQTKLEALKRAIQDGINSGESTPLDIEDIIKRGHERLAKKKK